MGWRIAIGTAAAIAVVMLVIRFDEWREQRFWKGVWRKR
jgi:hypothetical protein